MTLRLGLTNDVDFAPLCFPWEAGWVLPPTGVTLHIGPLPELAQKLLAGELDVAPVPLITYQTHQAKLRILPTPVRAFDLVADSIFLISPKRLDQFESVKVAVSPNSQTGEALLKLLAPAYYGITPQFQSMPSEEAALEAMQKGECDVCIMGGEAALKAVEWAKSKEYAAEDLTKAWWVTTGLPLPIYLFAVRHDWTQQEANATELVRSLMVTFRRGLQVGQEQRPTLLDQVEKRSGLSEEVLTEHFQKQRYDLNEAHLRGLLEFYRRTAAAGLAPALDDLVFFPTLTPLAATPAAPPRRSQPEAERPTSRPASNTERPRPRLAKPDNRDREDKA